MAKKSSRFASNVLKLAMGSAFAQGLVIILAPVLTRLFAPEAFALAAMFAQARLTHIAIAANAIDRPDDALAQQRRTELAVHLLDTSDELVPEHAAKAHVPLT